MNRGFRHDYAGMLVSMQNDIDSGDLQEIDRVYSEVLVKANQNYVQISILTLIWNNIEDSAYEVWLLNLLSMLENNDVGLH